MTGAPHAQDSPAPWKDGTRRLDRLEQEIFFGPVFFGGATGTRRGSPERLLGACIPHEILTKLDDRLRSY